MFALRSARQAQALRLNPTPSPRVLGKCCAPSERYGIPAATSCALHSDFRLPDVVATRWTNARL
jgi:hypothetical protein